MTVIKNKLKHPEFWEHVERVAAHVRTLPDWMKGSPVNERPKEDEMARDLANEQHGMVVRADAMVLRIRQSLQARLEGRNEGGDTEVMRLVDEIVKKEGKDTYYRAISHYTDY